MSATSAAGAPAHSQPPDRAIPGTGEAYFTSEFVNGIDLFEATAGLSWDEVYDLAVQLCRGLAYVHSRALVHRDVKPSNVRITPEGKPLLVDFGIARDLGAETLTGTAPFVGSPAYAAPEQIAGEAGAVDARTDVYSLGVTLYECLAGRAPWRAETLEQVFRAILAEEAPRLRRLDASIARDVEVVVAKAMEVMREFVH